METIDNIGSQPTYHHRILWSSGTCGRLRENIHGVAGGKSKDIFNKLINIFLEPQKTQSNLTWRVEYQGTFYLD